MKIIIKLTDKRGKLLFDSTIEQDFEAGSSLKSIVAYFKENRAEIVPKVIAGSEQQYSSNIYERLGMTAVMVLNFEWDGEQVEKKVYLNA